MCWCWDDAEVADHQSPAASPDEREFAMSAVDLVSVAVGSVFLLGGMVTIVAREFLTHPERRLVGRVRNVVEVVLPLAGAVVLVVAVWASAA
jgi:hypothetical protein